MITLYSYSLPFTSPFQAAGRNWEKREGVILRYQHQQVDIAAEAAPLPGFSRESKAETEAYLEQNSGEIDFFLESLKSFKELQEKILVMKPPSSAAFAISCLGFQLLEQRDPANAVKPDEQSVEVNALIGLVPEEQLLSMVHHRFGEGYRAFKIKADSEPLHLVPLLKRLAGELPEIRFRLDANRSWTYETACRFAEQVSELPIDYIEEPFADAKLEKLSAFKQQYSIQVALDESLESPETFREALDKHIVDVLILKPTLFGDLPQLIRLFDRKAERTPKVVVTSTLESAVGRSAVIRLAGIVGSDSLAHGLDTVRMFTEDLIAEQSASAHLEPERFSWAPDFEKCNTRLLNEKSSS